MSVGTSDAISTLALPSQGKRPDVRSLRGLGDITVDDQTLLSVFA